PVTATAFQSQIPRVNRTHAFLVKLSPSVSSLLYSTYLGVTNGNAEGRAIAVDAEGFAYATGWTDGDFPTTPGAFQRSNAGYRDAFAIKLDCTRNGSASVIFSTHIGGDLGDDGAGIAVDASGNAYIVGQTSSAHFPTINAFQSTHSTCALDDVFVSKL